MDDDTDVGDLSGINESTAEKLRDAGYETLGDLRGVDRSALFEVEGIGATRASEVLTAVEEATDDGSDSSDSASESDSERETDDGTDAEDGASSDGTDEGTTDGDDASSDDSTEAEG
ncbi:helix-hairpin-helix domain-containing protein, partial [Halobium palmae]